MNVLNMIKPKFWDHHDVAAGPFKHLFDFRRIWKQAVLITAGVTLFPLILMAVIDYKVTEDAINSEILLRTGRLVSNTRRSVSYFLEQRKSALDFVVHDNTFEDLNDPERLAVLLQNLREAHRGFIDLGVVDHLGNQRNYVGPYDLKGVNYGAEEWYLQVIEQGIYVSDVFLGVRKVPHFVIAVRHPLPDGAFYVVRATIDTERFNELLSQLDLSGDGDAFIINHDGVLQTPSRYYGSVLGHVPLSVPEYSETSQVLDVVAPDGKQLVVGYAYIETAPFILMICKQKTELIKPWRQVHLQVLAFLITSIVGILIVILGVSTFLVGRIYEADQKRVATLHQVEYANKMASIGRLAAGVAHEINNPLAIINEKAGLIKDLFVLKHLYARDEKLVGLVDVIIDSVERCATITRRLLSFARHMGGDSSVQTLHIKEVIEEVIGFLHKEAAYRSITVQTRISKDIPAIESDRGKLQQILLNLLNNAFTAMDDGGHLEIAVQRQDSDAIAMMVADNGCGIPEPDLKRIFEPFFSTKTNRGGTGLGLSITYGLVKELGGGISVSSELGRGTTFTITLPLKEDNRKGEADASVACRR